MSSEPPKKQGGDREARGESLARQIPQLELPEKRAEQIRRTMRQRLAAREVPSHAWRLAWVGIAAGLLIVALGSWLFLRSPRVRLETTEGLKGHFETLALATHAELWDEHPGLDLESTSPAEVRQWLESMGLSAALAANRSREEQRNFQLLGAKRLAADFPVAAVSYRIDGQPVTLVVTTKAHAPDVPRWSVLGKTVRASTDTTTSAHVLTWSNAGKAYSLVTELPARGLRACLICHTDQARRELVDQLASAL